MSRSIEAVKGEPAWVSMVRPRSAAAGRSAKPWSAAMVEISLNNARVRSVAPAATISPTAPRIRQVMPAAVAMNTHFSHISCRIDSLKPPSKPALAKSAAIAPARTERAPSSSPKVSR